MKKILITGNSGYIGSHLTALLGNEYELYGMDIQDPKVSIPTFFKMDITRPFYTAVPSQLDHKFDAIVHLAALVNVGESQRRPIAYYLTNLNGTMNVLNKLKTKHFIFASTGAAEGCASAYGISKRAAEDVVRSYCTSNDIDYTIFRFYNVIGSTVAQPTNPDGLMYNLLRAKDTGKFTIFGNDYEISADGTAIRDYVHVLEICDAIRTAIDAPSNSVECLGHGVGYSVLEIVNLFQKINGIDLEVSYGPRREGDLPISVLANVSLYMKSLYQIEDLLKVK